jgi:hypothetical protein
VEIEDLLKLSSATSSLLHTPFPQPRLPVTLTTTSRARNRQQELIGFSFVEEVLR